MIFRLREWTFDLWSTIFYDYGIIQRSCINENLARKYVYKIFVFLFKVLLKYRYKGRNYPVHQDWSERLDVAGQYWLTYNSHQLTDYYDNMKM